MPIRNIFEIITFNARIRPYVCATDKPNQKKKKDENKRIECVSVNI